MHEILTSMIIPPYRRVLTGSDFFIILENGKRVDVKCSLPHISLQIGKSLYKKYYNPDEINILNQARFDNWSIAAQEFFESKLGSSFNQADPTKELVHVYERSKVTKEEPDIFERHVDLKSSHSTTHLLRRSRARYLHEI